VTDGPECLLAEKPGLGALAALRYEYLPPEHAEAAREGLNDVLLGRCWSISSSPGTTPSPSPGSRR
jgi:hypothetical protein